VVHYHLNNEYTVLWCYKQCTQQLTDTTSVQLCVDVCRSSVCLSTALDHHVMWSEVVGHNWGRDDLGGIGLEAAGQDDLVASFDEVGCLAPSGSRINEYLPASYYFMPSLGTDKDFRILYMGFVGFAGGCGLVSWSWIASRVRRGSFADSDSLIK